MSITHRVMIGLVAMMAVAAPAEVHLTVYDCGTLGGDQTKAEGTKGFGLSDNQCMVGVSTYINGAWRGFRDARILKIGPHEIVVWVKGHSMALIEVSGHQRLR